MANELFDKRLRELRELNEEIHEAGFEDLSNHMDDELDYIESIFQIKDGNENFDVSLFVFTMATRCFKYAGYLDGAQLLQKESHREFESRLIDAWYQLYLSVK